MKRTSLLLILTALLLVGCDGSKKTQIYDGQGNSVESGPRVAQISKPIEAPKAKPEDVPASVKTDAWEYFGCSSDQTIDVELRVKGRPTKTGGVSIKLDKVEGEKAIYTIERTGAIADDLGNETIEADATGIYTTANTTATVTPARNLTLPSGLSDGKTWPSASKVVRNDGQELEEKSTFKVVGVQDVTTKRGPQKALLVTSTGTATVSLGEKKQQAKYETKSWYVKGRGPVKLEITLALPGQPVNTVIVEETK